MRLLCLSDLDKRTTAYRRTEFLISRIENDLGGADQLSAAQAQIVSEGQTDARAQVAAPLRLNLAAELAARQVLLILAAGRPDTALAVKSVTTSIPIVFNNASDPVQLGLRLGRR